LNKEDKMKFYKRENNLQIKEQFKNLLPPLSQEEFNNLEESILKDGCMEFIKVWEDKINNIIYLIDGHNRYNICTKHNIKFEIKEMQFNTYEDVLDWIINNQFSRRNINDTQKSYLRGLQYEREKLKHGGSGNNQYTRINNKNIKTAERIGQQYQVSEKAIREDGKFASALNKISEIVGIHIKNKILNKDINIAKQDIIKISRFKNETILDLFESGDYMNLKININKIIRKPIPQTTIKHLINKSKGYCEICNWGGLGLEGILLPHHTEKYCNTKSHNIDKIIMVCPNCHSIIHTLENCKDKNMIDIILNSIDKNIKNEIINYVSILNSLVS